MPSSNIKYPILALDMDGTLLNSRREITLLTLEALQYASRCGVEIVLSTGRCRAELTPYFDILPQMNYCIMESGACVFDLKKDRVIYSAPLSEKEIFKIMDIIGDAELMYQFFFDSRSYLSIPDSSLLSYYHMESVRDIYENTSVFDGDLIRKYIKKPQPAGKVNLYFHKNCDRTRVWDALVEAGFAVATSLPHIVEVSAPGANKGLGLLALCDYLGLTPAQVIAVGDSSNDFDLLKTAGMPVAMENAIPELKAIAKDVTKNCDEDGVAAVIKKYYSV